MYDSILVPVDGSDESMAAVQEAADLATVHDAVLHVLYVVDSSTAVNDAPMDVLSHLEQFGEEAIERARDVADDAGVRSVQGSVMMGLPVSDILEYVDEEEVELVVMGTHGRSGLDRLLLGSVTEKVVRASPVPVLTVRTHGDD
ncbi:universal stress protein [Halobacteriales archaeon Cl-PHB]